LEPPSIARSVSDEAILGPSLSAPGSLRFARDDEEEEEEEEEEEDSKQKPSALSVGACRSLS
jgi:hypothetical protein